ncbi:free fatty acid receptor 4-like [Neocloeon triangulifer]|uniref:free fatty acid receptor 4-like n=1 Tax=Neocloeon triangulifer TaxID=2078957 RepID=UPI00286EF156|nr:free fatty acid receptor 4-like [Neocloeon triangulifer]
MRHTWRMRAADVTRGAEWAGGARLPRPIHSLGSWPTAAEALAAPLGSHAHPFLPYSSPADRKRHFIVRREKERPRHVLAQSVFAKEAVAGGTSATLIIRPQRTAMPNTSYLFGNDTEYGWGPRYFFAFYSEFGGDGRRTMAVLEATALLAIVVTSVLANAAIAAAIVRYREMRTVTNTFLLNLALADLVFALGAPLVAATRLTQHWTLGETLCKALPYSQFVCGSVLLWTLTLISIDRHRCIVVPPYRSRLTPQRAGLLVLATWSMASVLFIPMTFWFHQQQVGDPLGGPDVLICTLVFPQMNGFTLSLAFTVSAVLFACVLPMVLLVYHYQRIFHKLLTTRSRWMVPASSSLGPQVAAAASAELEKVRRDSQISFTGIVGLNKTLRKLSVNSRMAAPRGSVSMTQHEELRLSKHLRVVRVLLLNVVLVLLMWLPITLVMVLIYIDGRRSTAAPLSDYFLRSCHFVWALILALLNTVVNPLLYGVFSENFRACLCKMWGGGGGGGSANVTCDLAREAEAGGRKSSTANRNCSSGAASNNALPKPAAPGSSASDRSPSSHKNLNRTKL